MFRLIKFYNYKNLENQEIEIPHKTSFVIGENGSGKTNFVSSIYFLSYGNFERNDKVIKNEEKEMKIEGDFEDESGIDNNVKIEIKNDKKEIFLNDKILKDRKHLIGRFPCIFSSYNDFYSIASSPGFLRRFFDQSIILKDQEYLENIRNYAKILKNRNFLLKNLDYKMLDAYDYSFAKESEIIIKRRGEVVKEFCEALKGKIEKVLGLSGEFKIRYKSSFKNEDFDGIMQEIIASREKDLKYRTTNKGIHRDHFEFLEANKDFSQFSSTGQFRVLAIFLKIIQESILQKEGVFIFDDVFVELDDERRKELLSFIPNHKQIFFTTFSKKDVDKFQMFNDLDKSLITIKSGKIHMLN